MTTDPIRQPVEARYPACPARLSSARPANGRANGGLGFRLIGEGIVDLRRGPIEYVFHLERERLRNVRAREAERVHEELGGIPSALSLRKPPLQLSPINLVVARMSRLKG